MQKQRGTKDRQETKRLLVVTYLKKKKGTHEQAAEMFQLSRSAVDKIWTRYKTNFM
jgi:transposase